VRARPRRPVRFIWSAAEAWELLPACYESGIIGLDIETLMDCKTWCLSQIALPDFTAIVDMLAFDARRPIARLAEDGRIIKVAHNASFERSVLRKYGIGLENVFDTLVHSRRRRGEVKGGHSLGAVCRRELGLTLDKSWWSSDWRRRPLPRPMYDYAALDAEVLLDLYRIFRR
jgi:ribonuclease D